MKTIELAFDDARWADVPLEFPAGPYATQDEWAAAVAEEYSEGADDPVAARTALEQVARLLPASPALGLYRTLWYQADPLRVPLVAEFYVAPEEAAGGLPLDELAGAFDAGLVRPPIVDTLDSARFGSIARVISVTQDPGHNRLVMRLCAAGRLDGLVILIDARTTELDYGALALDDFTALMEGVSVVDTQDSGA